MKEQRSILSNFWKVWLEDDPSKINKSKIVTLKDGLSKIPKLQIATLKDGLSKIIKSKIVTLHRRWPIKDNQVKIMTLKDGLSKITTVKSQLLTSVTNYFLGGFGCAYIYKTWFKTRSGCIKEIRLGKLSFYSFVFLYFIVQ